MKLTAYGLALAAVVAAQAPSLGNAAAVALALTFSARTSPALAQEDGLKGGQIILVQDKPRTGASKLKCETVKVWQCTAGADGKLTNCHWVNEQRCTVVSGPGAVKQ